MKKQILNNAVFSAIQTILSAALLFFLYRFLLKHLGAESLGVWAVVLSSMSVGRLTDMGLSGTIVKFVAQSNAAGDIDKSSRLIQTAAITIAAALTALLLLALPLLNILLRWVLPEHAIPQAVEILPYAVVSLLLTMVSAIFQSGIDACHRMDIKNVILATNNFIYVGLAFILVPSQGLKGIALAQTVQGALLLGASWITLKRLQAKLPIIPLHWHRNEFREMVGYATNFQVGMVAGLFFDPATKFLLAKFGGLSLTAFYEMANQLLMKARTVIVSAQQALVPAIAGQHGKDSPELMELYTKSYSMSFMLVMPYYMAIIVSLPLISNLWIGHQEGAFIAFGSIMAIGWLASNLSAIPYFYNMGTGELHLNTLNHIAAGLINFTLGSILGAYFSGDGVVIAAALALFIPNVTLVLLVNRKLGLQLISIVPADQRTYLLTLMVGLAAAFAARIALAGVVPQWQKELISIAIFVVFGLFALKLNPTTALLRRRIRK